jgi:signal transduction histidine kinase
MTHTILRNLVANAIKFTPNDGNISLSAIASTSVVSISVSDTGKGMTPEIVESLFLLSSNKHKRNEAEGKGTGLGLILCKELVEQQGGKIGLDRTSSQGSVFSFTLPIHPKKA